MSVLLYSIALVVTAFLLHISIWKISQPTHQKSILIAIFSLTLASGLFILFYFRKHVGLLGIKAPQEIFEYLQICIFYISVNLAYMVTYSALEADSPSLVMIMTIAKAGETGLDKRAFEEKINDDILIMPRLNDILSEKLAYLDNGIYRLTPKGRLIAYIFIAYRKIIKREKKGG